MQLVFGHDETVVRWAERKAGWAMEPPWTGIGIIDKAGSLKGALILQKQTDACSELTLYSEGAVTPGIAKKFFQHVFIDLGVHRLQVRTERSNKAVREAAPRWGFKFECRAVGYWGHGKDALLYSMTADQCRWIKPPKLMMGEAA